MKKAFTLSEALITLAIIAVLAAILIPVISNVRPDKDKIHYKKALYTLQSAMTNAMDSKDYSMVANTSAYWGDASVGQEDFCKAIADSLNVAGGYRCSVSAIQTRSGCSGATKSSYKCPNFITTDGIRYWGLEGKEFDLYNPDLTQRKKVRTIYADRNIGDNELVAVERDRGRTGDNAYGLQIQVRYDGKMGVDLDNTGGAADSQTFAYERKLTEQSLRVQAGSQ